MTTNEHKMPMELNLTREQVKNRIFENLVQAGVLLRSEIPRYEKILETYNDITLLQVMIVSWELREAGGEIIT
ncbi:unnamed protein product [marine sediment metagenome]|uniref:Uncharacterized protein n=2 Tax=marine sediment metagenome TaxID=412755 RepID=X1VGL6_9ZZZZ